MVSSFRTALLASVGMAVACGGPSSGDTSQQPPKPQVVTSLAESEGSLIGGPGDAFGYTMAFAGDLGGDGRQSFVVSTYTTGDLCVYEPDVGTAQPSSEALACYAPVSATEFAGFAISAGRDVTGDHQPDVLVGAVGHVTAEGKTGAVYVLSAPFADGELTDAFATFEGEGAGDEAGTAASFAGDVDGDGFEDVWFGGWANDEGGLGAGKAYLFRGPLLPGNQSLADADSAILGVGLTDERHGAPTEGDGVGSVVAGIGDYDGDGLADVGLGVNGSDVGALDGGLVAVFYGPIDAGIQPLGSADRSFEGGTGSELSGDNVVPAGDVDGDGRDDLLASGDSLQIGRVWLIRGGTDSGPLSSVEPSFEGESIGDLAGFAMSAAGDVNGDGHSDLVIGAYRADPPATDAGAVYVVHGPVAGSNRLADAPHIWTGEALFDTAGLSLAGGEDVNGDGRPDLLVGAPNQDDGGPFAGKVYLLLSP